MGENRPASVLLELRASASALELILLTQTLCVSAGPFVLTANSLLAGLHTVCGILLSRSGGRLFSLGFSFRLRNRALKVNPPQSLSRARMVGGDSPCAKTKVDRRMLTIGRENERGSETPLPVEGRRRGQRKFRPERELRVRT